MIYLGIKENEPTLFPEMEVNIAIRNFIRFLYRNKVYNNFKKNFAEVDKGWIKTHHEHACHPCSFIETAFRWSSTPEQHFFWADIHVKWVKLYRKEIKR